MKTTNVLFLGLMFGCSLAAAQTSAQGATDTTGTSTTTTTTTTTTAQPATASTTTRKLTSEFSAWAGSEENAAALVNGLRTGSTITLNAAADGSAGQAPTTFSPTTKPMGYGNIRIALSMARVQLANQGIANPTPEQLQGALVGTSGSSTQGILQMRAAGMGWGQIANSTGVKLGSVMSGKYVAPPPAAPTTGSGNVTAGAGTSTVAGNSRAHNGVVTASGGSAGGIPAGKPSGITSGVGAGASAGVTTGMGHAYGQGGMGAVNAGGARAGGGAAHGNAGGNGKGGGKP